MSLFWSTEDDRSLMIIFVCICDSVMPTQPRYTQSAWREAARDVISTHRMFSYCLKVYLCKCSSGWTECILHVSLPRYLSTSCESPLLQSRQDFNETVRRPNTSNTILCDESYNSFKFLFEVIPFQFYTNCVDIYDESHCGSTQSWIHYSTLSLWYFSCSALLRTLILVRCRLETKLSVCNFRDTQYI